MASGSDEHASTGNKEAERLFGEDPKRTTIDDIFMLRLFGQLITGISIEQGSFSTSFRPKSSEFASSTKSPSSDDRHLYVARIFGYSLDGRDIKLAKPVILAVPNRGNDITNSKEFPNSQYLAWDVDPDDRTLRCDLMIGSVEDLVKGIPDWDGAPLSGATLIRGADGKMYCIPEDLDSYEVVNEADKSELLLSEKQARPDLSIGKTSSARSFHS
jgi:hypothetical protein